jgi:ribosomal protein L7/L12
MSDDADLAARLAYIEEKLGLLWHSVDKRGISGTEYVPFAEARKAAASSAFPGVPEEVVGLAKAGRKVQALMAYHQLADVSKEEARRVVDEIERSVGN